MWREFSVILPLRAVGCVILLMFPLKSVVGQDPSTDGVTEAVTPSRLFLSVIVSCSSHAPAPHLVRRQRHFGRTRECADPQY